MHFTCYYDKDEWVSERDGMTWGSLKYGYCSYFALAYGEIAGIDEFYRLDEYDEDMDSWYFVHYVVKLADGRYLDALGEYEMSKDPGKKFSETMDDFTDGEFMEITSVVIDRNEIIERIEEDMGFDEDTYQRVLKFIRANYVI